MSDQRRTGAVISLEEIFTSRDFGRRPARWDIPPVSTVEASDPPLLEQVFQSELFGHPEAVVAPSLPGAAPVTPSAGRPALVLLSGRGDAERDLMRYRGAIGAVSGVAAAALVVAGMTSGTGSRSEQPTLSAQGNPPGQGGAGGGGSFPGPGGVATQPGTTGPTPGSSPAATGGAVPAPIAHVASSTSITPASAAVLVGEPAPAPVVVAPAPPAPGGGTTPSGPAPGPAPGGGGSVLTPVLVTAGTTVASVGSTVTAASNDLAHAVPALSPVTGLLGNVGATVTNLGQSVAGA